VRILCCDRKEIEASPWNQSSDLVAASSNQVAATRGKVPPKLMGIFSSGLLLDVIWIN
jgi:hypothetical protein